MVISGDGKLTMKDFYRVLFEKGAVKLDSQTLEQAEKNYLFLDHFIQDKIIYGINTGLGPMAQYKVDDDKYKELQVNLIRSHAAGTGEPIDSLSLKAAMIGRLRCFSNGASGVHPEVLKLLKEMINRDIIPYVPEHGGVGASGDLVQLAHLALTMLGEGKVMYKGQWQSTASVFDQLNLKPISIHIREGLGLINGTSVMTGVGIVNVIHARNLLNWMLIASVLINELVETFNDHYSFELNSTKLHHGQNVIARAMGEMLQTSKLTQVREDVLFNNNHNGSKIEKKVQEYYSIRCVPQILGPIYDTLVNAEQILEQEVNSVNDNPVIDEKNEYVFHGGNFHGDYVSLEMDKLKMAITKLSMLSERQLNFLMNDKLNEVLPPFVNLGTLGLELGMQGAQFTATSTVAENQTLSAPMYVHSIPSNNENQDMVSMGTNSALIARKVIDNAFQALSVELISLIQGVDYLAYQDRLSEGTRSAYEKLREVVPRFNKDKILYKDIQHIKSYIMEHRPEFL